MKCKWGDIISLEYGKPVADKNSLNGPVPVYGTNGEIGTSWLPPLCNNASVILGRKGAYRGVHYSSKPFSVIDTAFYVKPLITDLNLLWVYYKFLTYDINRMDSGSAIPSTDRYEIYSLPLDLPELSIQNTVADTLSALDTKIFNNKMVNHHLEQMARAMYNEFLTSGSGSDGIIADIADINLHSYSPREKWDFVNYLDTSNITRGVISEIQFITDVNDLPSRARRKVTARDIIYSTVRPNQRHYGLVSAPIDNMLVSTGFSVIHSNDHSVSNEYLYMLLSSDAVTEQLQAVAEQSVSTYPSIKPSDIGSLGVFIPSNGEDLHGQLHLIFEKISNANDENRRLAALRDALLPRLMSGELSVADL